MESTNTLIVGAGEIGSSLYEILTHFYPVWMTDILPEKSKMDGCPKKIDVMHVCIRYSENFFNIISEYIHVYNPDYMDICTTVPVGTTEKISPDACHSTTRGLHPHLVTGLKTIPKHIGGGEAESFRQYFYKAGIPSIAHPKSRTTELLHILNNAHYGVNLMFADDAAKLCREYGVDFFDYLKYTESNNDGYLALGHKTKVRPILTPPGGRIGGHCVNMSAGLIPEEKRPPLIDRLAKYNN